MPVRIVVAGICTIGVCFGMARYGYGLLLPDIRADLGLTSAQLGAIATGGYAAYLLATVAAPALSERLGPRWTIVAGLALAASGMVCAGVSEGPALLVAGMLVAGASAGLAFPPFSDVVAAVDGSPRAFSAISAGTGWGVAAAVGVALVAGAAWRAAWLVYAALAVLAAVVVLRSVPAGARRAPAGDRAPLRLSWFVCPRSGPLLAGALLVGLGSAMYWTFAVDLLVVEGGAAPGAARLLLIAVGLASVLGALAGDAILRLGAGPVLVGGALALSASLMALAAAPGAWPVAVLSGVLFGAAYNVVVALQGVWSALVFRDRPSTGLAAVMFMLGAGLLAGPLLAGALEPALGLRGVFVLGAVVVLIAGALRPREPLVAPAAT